VITSTRSEWGIFLINCDFLNVGVNTPGTNKNVFFNQTAGIGGRDCEGLGIFNTEMININSTDQPMLYGIYTYNCQTTINHNMISKVRDGIFQEFSDLKASKNTITALDNGIYCKDVFNRNVKITDQNSIIGKNGGIGITGVGSPVWTENVIEIGDNKLISGGDYGGITAQFLFKSLLWIHDNPDIKASGTGNGIYLSNCAGKGLIHNNTINQPSQAGIYLSNTRGYHFVQNTINGGEYGLIGNMAENNLFCCTKANGSSTGAEFQTSCSNTRLWNTEFINNFTGLRQSETAMLSVQLNRGNFWNLGDPLSTVDAEYYGSDDPTGLIQFNRYRISNTFKTNGNTRTFVIDPSVGTVGNPDNWHNIFGTDPSCTVPQGGSPETYCNEASPIIIFADQPSDGFSSLSPLDIRAIQNETSLDVEKNALKWLQRQYLYKKTNYNATFRNSDPSLSAFYLNNQSGVIGRLEAIESACSDLFLIPQSDQTQYSLLLAQRNTIAASIGQLDLILDDTTGGNPPNIIAQRQDLIQSVTVVNAQIQQIERAAKQGRLSQISALIAENNSIPVSDVWQQNEKTVFGIYLATIGSDLAISVAQKNAIEGISAQCPKEGGRGVFWARSLKKYWDRTPDDNSCLKLYHLNGQGSQERDQNSIHSSIGFKVYPSPTLDGFFTLEIPKSETTGGDFILTDISGRIWLSQKIQPDLTTVQIDGTSIPNGLYIHTFRGLGSMQHIGKIIIHKK
jgi:nitrous oxidase accessory protein NosD